MFVGNLMKKQNNNRHKQKGVGFFENLKDLGDGIARSTAEEAVKQITGRGTLKPEEPLEFEKYIAEREKEIRGEERRFYERRRAQEKILWTAEQQKTALQIETIQEELKKLVNETEGLSREIKTAAVQAIVEPGVYHLNFLERLLELIKLIRKKIQESKTWLAEWNAYCKKKRNYYWVQVKKSGTKFMLSSERYMATQAG